MEEKVKISYPRTDYYLLNECIAQKLNQVMKDFIEYGKIIIKQDLNYTLDIMDEKKCYQDIISYIFYLTIYTGGAHPNNLVYTVNYDRRSNKIITINDLIKNKKILNSVCIESREQLKTLINNDKNSIDMMLAGTTQNKSNFENFSFGETGITIYFQPYQIAPSTSGIYKIILPYSIFKEE